MREHFRGVLEWKHEKLLFNTPSDQACKMYDAVLSQLVSWANDPNLGGIMSTLDKMLEADPNFVIGQCLDINIRILSYLSKWPNNSDIQSRLDRLLENSKKFNLTNHEINHVNSVVEFCRGNIDKSIEILDKILIDHPNDIHAIRMLYEGSYYSGNSMKLINSLERIISYWELSDLPLKGYLHGYYSFGLLEARNLIKAEKEANKGLQFESDPLCIHNLAHINYDSLDGIKGSTILEKSSEQWRDTFLSRHIFWHWALFKLSLGEDIDSLLPKIIVDETDVFLDVADVCSLNYRLNLLGMNGFDWTSMFNNVIKVFGDNVISRSDNEPPVWFNGAGNGFKEAHYAMAICGKNEQKLYSKLGLPIYPDNRNLKGEKHNNESKTIPDSNVEEKQINSTLNTSNSKNINDLISAIIAYKEERFDNVVDLLNPILPSLHKLGGSNAQREVFDILLIVAALRSSSENNRKYGEQLLIDREKNRTTDKTNQRLRSWLTI